MLASTASKNRPQRGRAASVRKNRVKERLKPALPEDESVKDLTRKEALSSLIILPALAGMMLGTAAVAQAKGTKTQFKYQDHPNGKQACAGCSLFIAGKTATAAGTCKVVAGPISPKGWCVAYAAKP